MSYPCQRVGPSWGSSNGATLKEGCCTQPRQKTSRTNCKGGFRGYDRLTGRNSNVVPGREDVGCTMAMMFSLENSLKQLAWGRRTGRTAARPALMACSAIIEVVPPAPRLSSVGCRIDRDAHPCHSGASFRLDASSMTMLTPTDMFATAEGQNSGKFEVSAMHCVVLESLLPEQIECRVASSANGRQGPPPSVG